MGGDWGTVERESGVGIVVVGMAFHVFERGHVFGDLDGLYDQKHGYPYQLENCPDGQCYRPCIAEDKSADVV